MEEPFLHVAEVELPSLSVLALHACRDKQALNEACTFAAPARDSHMYNISRSDTTAQHDENGGETWGEFSMSL